jgi:hypothetical protein
LLETKTAPEAMRGAFRRSAAHRRTALGPARALLGDGRTLRGGFTFIFVEFIQFELQLLDLAGEVLRGFDACLRICWEQ